MKLYSRHMPKRILAMVTVSMLLLSLLLPVSAAEPDASSPTASTLLSPDLAIDEILDVQTRLESMPEETQEASPQLFSTVAYISNLTDLDAALSNSGIITIILEADLPLDGTRTVAGNRDLTITSSDGNKFTITSSNARHFEFASGSNITFSNVILDGNNAHGGIVVDGTGAKSTLTIDSVTIQNCFTPANVLGGAIYVEGTDTVHAEVLITGDSLLKNNKAYWGGGATLYYTDLTVEGNSVFEQNSLYLGGGGGIFLYRSPAVIQGNAKFLGNGRVDSQRQQPGGAIFVYDNAPLNIRGNVLFEGNVGEQGGAICAGYNTSGYSYTSAVTITGDVIFRNNTAHQNGGAIYTQSTSTINIGTDGNSNVQFFGNMAQNGHGGGAVYSWYAELNIGAGTAFDGNKTGALSGAAVYARKSTLTITGTENRPVLFQNGSAQSCGGAICLIEGNTAIIQYAHFLNNWCSNFGGAIDIDGSTASNTVTIENSLFEGNVSNSTGGGIAVEVGSNNLTIRDSIIHNNFAGGSPHSFNYRIANGNGGGIYFENGSLEIYDSEIIGNASPKSGGGIGIGNNYTSTSLLADFLGSIEIQNTVFYNNSASALHTLSDPTYVALHAAKINPLEGKTYSLGLDYAYNNYDISYPHDPLVDPLPTVTVTYDALGGTPVPPPVSISINDGIDRPGTDPELVGHTFIRWVTEAGGAWEFNTTPGNPATGAPVRQDMTLYAKYEPIMLTVTFMNESVQVDQTQVSYGTPVAPTTESATQLGYTFLFWADEDGDEWNFDTPITQTTILYAVFAKNVTLTYKANTGDGQADIVRNYTSGMAITVENNLFSHSGYTFTGWNTYDDGSGQHYSVGEDFTIGDSGLILYAQWRPNGGGPPTTYTVTYHANGGTGSYRDTGISSGSNYRILTQSNTGITRDGYTFTGWNTKANGSGTAYAPSETITVTSNVTLYAQWQETPPDKEEAYTVVYNPNSGTGTAWSITENVGDAHYVLANSNANLGFTRPGHTFRGWSTDASATSATYFGSGGETIGADAEAGNTITLYAVWSTLSPPGGGGGGEPGTIIEEEEIPLGFLDFSNHFAYIIGYPDGTVRPEGNITRAEVAAIFFRLLTQESRAELWSTANAYPDVGSTAWYNNAISTLTNAHIIKGYTDGTFQANSSITRAEFAVIAARFAKAEDIAYATGMAAFSDIHSHWAEDHITLAGALGYVQGYEDGTFRPNEPITRAEVVTLLNNVLNRHVESEEDMLNGMTTWLDNTAGTWYYYAMQEATNSHFFDRKEDGIHEMWTEFRPSPDWSALEKPDSIPGAVIY